MSSTITCEQCGMEIEVSQALSSQLQKQIEQQVLAAEHKKHQSELAAAVEKGRQAVAAAEEAAKQERAATQEMADRKLAGAKELLEAQAKAELDLAKQKLAAEAASTQKQQAAQQEMLVKSLRDDAEAAKQDSKELREQLTGLMQSLREEKKARADAELAAQKKMVEEEAKLRGELNQEKDKMREAIQKESDEKQRLNIAAKEKTISDLQKALDEAQRKAAQGSQQLQGEIMELDLERSLAEAFREDDVAPVPKGVNGADIAHMVRTPRGNDCGLILWEIKRTKNWTEGWVPKLKEDVRSAKAALAVIVSEVLPKDMAEDLGQVNGVWVCKPSLAIVLGSLLRKSLLDVARQKALADNRGDKADALYSFVTSHEFVQQVESMVETYQDMVNQVTKERVAYERLWSQREKQAQKLLLSTANIIGSVQGHIGVSSMPRIKGLDLLEAGDEDDAAGSQTGTVALL